MLALTLKFQVTFRDKLDVFEILFSMLRKKSDNVVFYVSPVIQYESYPIFCKI